MENLKKILPSGAELEVTLASFAEGHRLFKVVTKELETIDFKEDTVQKMAFRLIASEAVEQALWPCMGRATYNQMKVNADLFEDAGIRGDFLAVAKEVLVFNLLPFSKGLDSVFSTFTQKNTDTQK